MFLSMLWAIFKKDSQKCPKNHSFANSLGVSMLRTPFCADKCFMADSHFKLLDSLGFESKNAERHCSQRLGAGCSTVLILTFTNTVKISKNF
ncbi:hypothetical protein R83H12_01275 [Fibrobacteria bacterium R8-3-H12]